MHFGERRNSSGYYSERSKFSLRATDERVREGLNVLEEAFEQAKGHQITAMEVKEAREKAQEKHNTPLDGMTVSGEMLTHDSADGVRPAGTQHLLSG